MRSCILLAPVLLAACSGGQSGNEATGNTSNQAATAEAATPTCDMTSPGDRNLGPTDSPGRTPERIRQVARWDEEMREKAKRCAEQAGFTNVSRMVARPAGSHVKDANDQWTRTTEETWLGTGTRGGRTVPVVVTAGGRVEEAPATQGS